MSAVDRRHLLEGLKPPPPWPRPPGAVQEADFAARCDGCMACAVACPPAAIALWRDGTPVLDPNRAACHLCDPAPCVAACDRGALVDLPREAWFFGLAEIAPERCLPFAGPECGACRPACPVGAIAMEGVRPVVDADRCLGCGLCREACPVWDPAIRVVW